MLNKSQNILEKTREIKMFSKTQKTITREEIDEIEKSLGITLPQELLEHYLKYNGGVPEKPCFYSEESDVEIEIQSFSPLKYSNDDLRTLEEKYVLFKEKSDLMTRYLPFANDYGANRICIGLENGKIYVVYMDLGEITDDSVVLLADSFNEFIDGLEEPEDE